MFVPFLHLYEFISDWLSDTKFKVQIKNFIQKFYNFSVFQIEMAHETRHLKELGGYSLLQCKPCLVKDLLCVAVGETIRVYSGICQNVDNEHTFWGKV